MRGVVFFVLWLVSGAAAMAEPCAGNPGALGTSRDLVGPNEFRHIGSFSTRRRCRSTTTRSCSPSTMGQCRPTPTKFSIRSPLNA